MVSYQNITIKTMRGGCYAIIRDMSFPETCPHCGAVNEVDCLALERRPLSKVLWVEGYRCQTCNQWKPVFYSNRLLDEALRKLETMRPDHPSFAYHFAKTVRRAQDIQRRGLESNGTFRHQNMAST